MCERASAWTQQLDGSDKDHVVVQRLPHNMAVVRWVNFADAINLTHLPLPGVTMSDGSEYAMALEGGLLVLEMWSCLQDIVSFASVLHMELLMKSGDLSKLPADWMCNGAAFTMKAVQAMILNIDELVSSGAVMRVERQGSSSPLHWRAFAHGLGACPASPPSARPSC